MKRRDLFKRLAGSVAAMVGVKLGGNGRVAVAADVPRLGTVSGNGGALTVVQLKAAMIAIPQGRWVVDSPIVLDPDSDVIFRGWSEPPRWEPTT